MSEEYKNAPVILAGGNREKGISGEQISLAHHEKMKALTPRLYQTMTATTIPPEMWDTRPLSSRPVRRALERQAQREARRQKRNTEG